MYKKRSLCVCVTCTVSWLVGLYTRSLLIYLSFQFELASQYWIDGKSTESKVSRAEERSEHCKRRDNDEK